MLPQNRLALNCAAVEREPEAARSVLDDGFRDLLVHGRLDGKLFTQLAPKGGFGIFVLVHLASRKLPVVRRRHVLRTLDNKRLALFKTERSDHVQNRVRG